VCAYCRQLQDDLTHLTTPFGGAWCQVVGISGSGWERVFMVSIQVVECAFFLAGCGGRCHARRSTCACHLHDLWQANPQGGRSHCWPQRMGHCIGVQSSCECAKIMELKMVWVVAVLYTLPVCCTPFVHSWPCHGAGFGHAARCLWLSCVCCVLGKVGGERFVGVLSSSRVAASFPRPHCVRGHQCSHTALHVVDARSGDCTTLVLLL
jgi:hypothetical protein